MTAKNQEAKVLRLMGALFKPHRGLWSCEPSSAHVGDAPCFVYTDRHLGVTVDCRLDDKDGVIRLHAQNRLVGPVTDVSSVIRSLKDVYAPHGLLRSPTKIKALLEAELRLYHSKVRTLNVELEIAVKNKRAHCEHPEDKIKIVNQSYTEAGRMSHPVEWREKVCRRCGAVVATESSSTTKTWTSLVSTKD